MKEPVHPGFTMLPFTDKSFKDGTVYGAAQEREATFKWLISRTLSGGDIETHSMLQTDYVTNVLKPADLAPYTSQIFYRVDPAEQERRRILEIVEYFGQTNLLSQEQSDNLIASIKGEN
jgi:hypothetical protein